MFRIGVSTIAAAALLAGAAASPAAAAAADSGLEQLWEEFPLDDERQEPAPHTPATDEGPATARAPAPGERRPAGRPADAGTSSWATERIGLFAAVLALIVAAAAAAVARFRGASRRQGSTTTAPTLRWLPPQPAPSPAVSPVGGDVVGGLLRAASAGVPRQRAAKLGQTPKGPSRTARAEIAVRKPLAEALKQPTAEADAEAEVLKRKDSAATLAVKVKNKEGLTAKSEGGDARTKEQLASTEGVLLKEKLAPKGEPKRSAAPVENGLPGRGAKSRVRRESALRPVPASGAESHARPRAAAGETRLRECEVEWWRGYVKSAFYAIETSSGGFGSTIASSPFFRWRKSDVPRETPEAAAALRSLVESLEREGWTVAGRRKEWFGVKLRTAIDVEALGITGGHKQTHIG
jgi:hypothetical protein